MLTSETRFVAAAPERVFAELGDAWIFPAWVVGASHIRAVDGAWPEAGAKLHHRIGPWPMSISDTTIVIESEAPSRLVLRARMWPLGEARVELTVTPRGDGSEVTMAEAPMRGPARWLDNPLQRFALRRRNRESLARLATLAEKRPLPGFDQR